MSLSLESLQCLFITGGGGGCRVSRDPTCRGDFFFVGLCWRGNSWELWISLSSSAGGFPQGKKSRLMLLPFHLSECQRRHSTHVLENSSLLSCRDFKIIIGHQLLEVISKLKAATRVEGRSISHGSEMITQEDLNTSPWLQVPSVMVILYKTPSFNATENIYYTVDPHCLFSSFQRTSWEQ